MKTPPTPYDLTVRVVRDDDPAAADHLTIEVNATYTWPEDGRHTLADTIKGYRWCASMFGRLATHLAEDTYRIRRDHGWCTGPIHCGITLTESSPVWRHAPSLSIDLPADLAPDYIHDWVTRINTTLAELVTSDQWQPTPEDEAAWCS